MTTGSECVVGRSEQQCILFLLEYMNLDERNVFKDKPNFNSNPLIGLFSLLNTAQFAQIDEKLEHLHRLDLKLETYTGMIARLGREFIVVEILKQCWATPAMT
jgi:hypothetical protein